MLLRKRKNYYAIADMCHAKFVWVEREEDQEPPPTLMQLYVEYNQDQCNSTMNCLERSTGATTGPTITSSWKNWNWAPTGLT